MSSGDGSALRTDDPPGLSADRHEMGPIASLDDFTPHRMAVVANRMSQSIGRLFETRFNLQIPDWRILMVLYAYGRLAFNDVVERTSMDKARVSRAHRRLTDLGLLATAADPKDGRRLILALTDKGAKICGEVLPEAARTEAWLLEALEPDERRQLAGILDKLMARTRLLRDRPLDQD